MNNRVLDASALLALLNREPGWEMVLEALQHDAYVSAVNWAEVVGKLSEAGMPENEVREVLESLPVQLVSVTSDLAFRIGFLRPRTRTLGLSLGDRACLALAESLGVPALTADRAWASLQIGVKTELIR